MSLMSTAAPTPSLPLAALGRPGTAPAEGGDDAGFAQALDAATAGQRDAAAPADPATAETPEARDRSRSRGLRRTAAELALPADPAEAGRPGAALRGTSDDDAAAPTEPEALDAPPADDSLAAWVDSLPLPNLPPLPAALPPKMAAGRAAGEAERTALPGVRAAIDTAALPSADATPQDPAAPGVAADGPPAALAALGSLASGAPARGLPGSAARAESPASVTAEALAARPLAAHEAAQPGSGPDNAPALNLLAPGWAVATPRSAEAAPVAQAEVRAEVGSREFAPALAGQLSLLVRDGIEQAQLKLNPAELGPIEVRIRIDGSQAQVDFSAAQTTTRQALQDAVPALAATLRESGLTLSGGGVFEQPRDPRGEARSDAPRGSGREADGPRESGLAGLAPTALPRARGVLDLYA